VPDTRRAPLTEAGIGLSGNHANEQNKKKARTGFQTGSGFFAQHLTGSTGSRR